MAILKVGDCIEFTWLFCAYVAILRVIGYIGSTCLYGGYMTI